MRIETKIKKMINMDIDNKTIIILGVLAMGMVGLWVGYNDLALAVVSGLLGFLTKTATDFIVDNSNNEINEISQTNDKE